MNILSKKLSPLTLLWIISSILFVLAPMAFFSADSIITIVVIMLSLVFLLISYKWPWVLITLAILAPSNYFHFLDLAFLPNIKIAQGIRIGFLDMLILCLALLGAIYFLSHRIIPLFAIEIIIFLGAIGLSVIWGLLWNYVDLDVVLGGLRQLVAYLFYLSCAALLYANPNRKYLINLLIGIVIISILIQFYEALSGARLVLPTSTNWFYDKTANLTVGNQRVPYLWNRVPALLFLLYFISLAQWFVVQSKQYLFLAVLIFVSIALTLVRSWLIYISIGSLFMAAVIFFTFARSKAIVFTSMALILLGGSVFVIYGLSTDSFYVILTRFSTLLNISNDSSLYYRLRSTRIFYALFLESPFFGHGPGSISLFEVLHEIWSTDVGLVSSLAGYGLIAVFALFVLLFKIFKTIRYALHYDKHLVRTGYMYGLLGFFFTATISFIFTQNFFFLSPWNFSVAIALVILDISTRNVRQQASLHSAPSMEIKG